MLFFSLICLTFAHYHVVDKIYWWFWWFYSSDRRSTYCSGNFQLPDPWGHKPPVQWEWTEFGLEWLLKLWEKIRLRKYYKNYKDLVVCPNVHLPDAANGEKMSIHPLSSEPATQRLSFSQNSRWSVFSTVFSDMVLSEGLQSSPYWVQW